ncbi:MAG: VWA domain-containing protein, partial [Deltaproteobacteria bacterium]|nr:VWA domain-containing protein [Deltaproteobacteria bacterium]
MVIDQSGKFYAVRYDDWNTTGGADWVTKRVDELLGGRKPVDAVLALDRSGSMNGNPPSGASESKIAILKDAVGLFMDVWEANLLPNDRIGVTDFASDVTQYSHTEGTTTTKLVPLETHATEVRSYVDSLSTGGFTCIGGAAAVSLDELAASTLRHIILFSDGMQNYNPVIADEAYSPELEIRTVSSAEVDDYELVNSIAGDSGVPPKPGQSLHSFDTRIHTIGVGLSGDPWSALMSRIASRTSGAYFETPAPEADLQNFYLNVLLELFKGASPQLVQHSSGVYDPNGDTVENSCCINSSAQWLTVALTWQGDPEDNRLVCNLQAPDGTL